MIPDNCPRKTGKGSCSEIPMYHPQCLDKDGKLNCMGMNMLPENIIMKLPYRIGDILRVTEGKFKGSEGAVVLITPESVELNLYKYPLYMGELEKLLGWHDWSQQTSAMMPDYLDHRRISIYKHSEVELIATVRGENI